MGRNTIDSLQDFLDENLTWRRSELSALKSEISRHYPQSPHAPLTRALIRSGMALLYAHWEGYIKESCEAYLDYVSVRRLRYQDLHDDLLITALRHYLKRLDSGDESARERLVEAVVRPSVARARLPRKNVINSRSNLRYDTLVEMFSTIGLPKDMFITRQQMINRSLCDARNEISHGRLHYPDGELYKELQKNILGMLEEVRDTIMRHARESNYSRTGNAASIKQAGIAPES